MKIHELTDMRAETRDICAIAKFKRSYYMPPEFNLISENVIEKLGKFVSGKTEMQSTIFNHQTEKTHQQI